MNCNVKRCRGFRSLIYYDRNVCPKHWIKHCDDDDKFDLKKEFGITK